MMGNILYALLIIALVVFAHMVLLHMQSAPAPVTVREATPLEKRVVELEKIAHEAPWWLADDNKGVK